MRGRLRLGLLLGVLPLLAGCASIGYYAHLTGGQLDLLADRRPVDRVLAELAEASADDPEAAALEARLKLSQAVLAYAEGSLGLPVGGRYRSYVSLERDAVVWNLFAAPPLSLEAHEWCYPFAGCAPYRGFFDRTRAEKDRDALEAQGFDTYLGAVSAYSTLGWFDDPLLSTFMTLDEADLVELLLHELSHSRVWVGGDVTFNESFASFVGRQGARSWFARQGRLAELAAHEASQADWRRARRVLDETRAVLADLYASARDDDDKQANKALVLSDAGTCLEALARSTGNDGYRHLTERLNNAYLASLATYADAQPVFERLFVEVDGDWAAFFAGVDALARLDDDQRAQVLAATSAEDQIAAQRDDAGADQVECQSLARHRFDAETPGAEHDDVWRRRHG